MTDHYQQGFHDGIVSAAERVLEIHRDLLHIYADPSLSEHHRLLLAADMEKCLIIAKHLRLIVTPS